MKRTYSKPEIYYENFALLDSIAGCDLKSNFNAATGCVAYYDERMEGWIFSEVNQGCSVLTQKDNNRCYGNPIQGFSIWGS